jgi:hypothetical protein
MMVELAYDDWTLNAKVESIVCRESTDPAKEGRFELALNFFQPQPSRLEGQVQDKLLDYLEH